MSSADFRLEIGETLCKLGLKANIKHRRSIENEIQAKKHKGPAQHVPGLGGKMGSMQIPQVYWCVTNTLRKMRSSLMLQ